MRKLDDFTFSQIPLRHVQTACLSLVALMTCGVLFLGRGVHPPLWHLMVMLINAAGMLFFGMTIREPMSRTARNLMLLSLGFCGWYLFLLLTDFRHFSTISYYGPRFVYQTCLCEYLMLLPWAAIRDEKGKAGGLKIMGACYAVGTVMLTLFTAILCLGIIPPGMHSILRWEACYLSIGWEPNVLASIFLMGILIKGIFLCLKLKPWVRVLLVLAMVPELCALALTDTKTTFVLVCVVLAGLVFFRIYQGGFRKPEWKRLVPALLAAVVTACLLMGLMLGVSRLNVAIFDSDINQRPHVAEMVREEQEKQDQERLAQGLPPLTEEEKQAMLDELLRDNVPYQEPENPVLRLLDKVTRLGGRREIWTAAVKEIAEQPGVLLFGTRDVPKFINNHGFAESRLGYTPAHAHNAWLQTLLQMGLVGFLFACWFTWLALKNGWLLMFCRKSTLFQKGISLLTYAILGVEFMEPYLFFTGYPYNFANILFLLCLGYLVYWGSLPEEAE